MKYCCQLNNFNMHNIYRNITLRFHNVETSATHLPLLSELLSCPFYPCDLSVTNLVIFTWQIGAIIWVEPTGTITWVNPQRKDHYFRRTNEGIASAKTLAHRSLIRLYKYEKTLEILTIKKIKRHVWTEINCVYH